MGGWGGIRATRRSLPLTAQGATAGVLGCENVTLAGTVQSMNMFQQKSVICFSFSFLGSILVMFVKQNFLTWLYGVHIMDNWFIHSKSED